MQIFKAELKSWMLGEFAPLKSKHDSEVASNRLPRRYAPRNDGNTCGRSMIEMLGVLAIVGVLSVAGISGFGKMMKAYHRNTASEQWTILFSSMAKYNSQLHINKTEPGPDVNLIPILLATGDLPDNMPITENNRYLVDAMGNKLQIYSHFTGYIGIGYFVEKNDEESCKMIFTAAKQNSKLINSIQIYTTEPKFDRNLFYGDYKAPCRGSLCIDNFTVSKINELCHGNNVCKDKNVCRYLLWWTK